jgi:hypothetical protein
VTTEIVHDDDVALHLEPQSAADNGNQLESKKTGNALIARRRATVVSRGATC